MSCGWRNETKNILHKPFSRTLPRSSWLITQKTLFSRCYGRGELFDWTTGGEQTPFPANKHHSYARVPFIIIFMTFCAFEGMDGVNTNEVCTDLLNVLQKKRLVTQAQHDCFQWGGDFASKLNLPRRRDALLSDDEKHGGSESRESRRFF